MNVILSILILIVFAFFIYFIFFRQSGNDLGKFEEDDVDRFSEEYLKNAKAPYIRLLSALAWYIARNHI